MTSKNPEKLLEDFREYLIKRAYQSEFNRRLSNLPILTFEKQSNKNIWNSNIKLTLEQQNQYVNHNNCAQLKNFENNENSRENNENLANNLNWNFDDCEINILLNRNDADFTLIFDQNNNIKNLYNEDYKLNLFINRFNYNNNFIKKNVKSSIEKKLINQTIEHHQYNKKSLVYDHNFNLTNNEINNDVTPTIKDTKIQIEIDKKNFDQIIEYDDINNRIKHQLENPDKMAMNNNIVSSGCDCDDVYNNKLKAFNNSSKISDDDTDSDNHQQQQFYYKNNNNIIESFKFNKNNNKNDNNKIITDDDGKNIMIVSTSMYNIKNNSNNKNYNKYFHKYNKNNMLDNGGDDDDDDDDYHNQNKKVRELSSSLPSLSSMLINNNNDNNKNKMNEGEEWNRSNYFTFAPATTFNNNDDRLRLDRTARWCHIRDSTFNKNCDKNIDNIINTEINEEKQNFKRYHEINKKILISENKDKKYCVDKNYELYNDSKKFIKNSYIKDNKKDNNNLNFKKPENNIKFSCIKRLLEMYTKLLQDKKSGNKLEVKDDVQSKNDKIVKSCNDGKLTEEKIDFDTNGNQKKDILQSDTEIIDLNRNSPLSDEGCTIGQSPYSSDYDDAECGIGNVENKEKVLRSSSNDSALGFEDDGQNLERSASPPPLPANTSRRMTLTVTDIPLRPSLLPVAEPTNLPDSPTTTDNASSSTVGLSTQSAIPSKVLLEERVVEIPEDRFGSLSSSRRESAQSCLSDCNSEYGGVRFVRTPSVVVSDYSDDVMCGITLEEIEYFRAHRMRRRRSSGDTAATEKDDSASDVSAASSCSNLYYCGSTISALDGADCYVNGMRVPIIDRKISDCSACSTISGDEDDENYFTPPTDFSTHYQNFHQDSNSNEQQRQQEQQQNEKNRKHKKVGD